MSKEDGMTEEKNTIEFTLEFVDASDKENNIGPDTEFTETDVIEIDHVCLYSEQNGFEECHSSVKRVTFDLPEAETYGIEVFDCEHGSTITTLRVSKDSETQLKLDGTRSAFST